MDLTVIKKLRDATGASISDCKKCLDDSEGDYAKAIELLRKRGAEIARKKSSRETTEGTIGMYLHTTRKLASMVELKCETDFVARTFEFQELAKDLAMHISAFNPLYKSPENIPDDVRNKEIEIEREKLKQAEKPAHIFDQIIEGRLAKFYEGVCLTKQAFIKSDRVSVEDLLKEKIQKLGENIEIGEFVRFEL